REGLKKAVMTLVLAATIPCGVLALTGGLAAMTFFEMAVNFGATTRYAGLTCGRFLRTLLPVASVTAAMAAAVCAVRLWVPLAPLPALLLQAAVGVLCYVGMSRLFRLEAWRTTLEIVKKLVGR
ncbi:MAG: lipopolysaccharide biosynthesis protein, partial [Alistipes sp.]|nr:lipopolysaccharide biosynthesis protein [Alistipes sp.]